MKDQFVSDDDEADREMTERLDGGGRTPRYDEIYTIPKNDEVYSQADIRYHRVYHSDRVLSAHIAIQRAIEDVKGNLKSAKEKDDWFVERLESALFAVAEAYDNLEDDE